MGFCEFAVCKVWSLNTRIFTLDQEGPSRSCRFPEWITGAIPVLHRCLCSWQRGDTPELMKCPRHCVCRCLRGSGWVPCKSGCRQRPRSFQFVRGESLGAAAPEWSPPSPGGRGALGLSSRAAPAAPVLLSANGRVTGLHRAPLTEPLALA